MKITVMNETNNSMKLLIEGISNSELNSIRRVMLREIPKLGLSSVEFHLGSIRGEDGTDYESVAPIFDEVIAHRLAMVPLLTDIGKYKLRKECSCNGAGCPLCTVVYTMNVKSDKKDGMLTVHSGDLKPVGGDPSQEVADRNIPIVKLSYKQGLLIYATAELGFGKDHVKWQVVGSAGYTEYPSVNIENKKCDECNECVKACPANILVIEKGMLKVTDESLCILCNACVKACSKNAIKISTVKDKFIFQFETDGSMSARKAFIYSMQYLKEQYSAIAKFASEI